MTSASTRATPVAAGEVSAASLVELKAELSRKRAAFEARRVGATSSTAAAAEADDSKRPRTASDKKNAIWSRKNKGVSQRSAKDIEERTEETADLQRSRTALEAKAKLYEQMQSGGDKGELPSATGMVYLVDFEKKAMDTLREQRRLADKKEKEEAEAAEEMVEYEDAFGRTRTCARKDLAERLRLNMELLKSMEAAEERREAAIRETEEEKRGVEEEEEEEEEIEEVQEEERIPQRKETDKMKSIHAKWDAQDEEKQEGDPIRYQDVLYDEVRQHGVGFYSFSRDEATRQEEMRRLEELRESTAAGRAKRERLLERRQQQQAARLARVRARKGLPPEEEKKEEVDSQKESIEKKLKEMRDVASRRVEVEVTRLGYRDENEGETSCLFPRRDWDREKFTMPPSLLAKQKQREEERLAEFAPPSDYY